MPTPPTGYRINGLDDVQAPLSGLANCYFEVEAPAGTAGQYTNLRLRGDRLKEWIGPPPVPNIRPIPAAQPTPPFALNEVGTYTLNGVEGFYRYKAPAGVAYAPPTSANDANWKQVAPPVTEKQGIISISEGLLVTLYNSGELAAYAGRVLRVMFRAGGAGDVAVAVLGNGALATDDAYLFNPANAAAPATPVTLAVSATATTTAARSGGGAVAFVAGQPLAPGQLVYNPATFEVFLVKQAIANPQTAPTLPLSAGLGAYYAFAGLDAPLTARVTNLETLTTSNAIARVSAPAYLLAGSTLTAYTSLQALVSAQTRAFISTPVHVTGAVSVHPLTSNGVAGLGFGSISGDEPEPASVTLATGTRLATYVASRVYLAGAGVLEVRVNAALGSRLEEGHADVVEFAAVTAGAVLPVTNFSVGAWSNPGAVAFTVELHGTSTVPAAPYPAGITVVDRTNVVRDQPEALATTSGTVTLDFAANPRRTLAATGNLTFATANRSAAGVDKTVRVKNTTATDITLAYEGWTTYPKGATLPATLAAGKVMILTLTCYGTSVSDVDAAAVLSN